jgi:hypothetical protein
MCTSQKLYEIERDREVKNIPLLKTLKSRIAEENARPAQIAQMRLELHQAASLEESGKYDDLQQRLALLIDQTDAPDCVSTAVITPVIPVTTVTNSVNTVVVVGAVPSTTTRDPDEDLFESGDDDDLFNMETNAPPEDVHDLHVGSIFRTPKDLQVMLQDFGKDHKFKVRIEKNAIVCANAGHSNWTDVCDYAARAQQSLRKIKQSQGDNDACVDDSMDANIEELLQLEEDKMVSQQFTPLLNTQKHSTHLLLY